FCYLISGKIHCPSLNFLSSLTINSQKRGLRSIPVVSRPEATPTLKVVPAPAKGSSTVPSGGHPTARHLSTNLSGKGAVSISFVALGRASMLHISSSILFF